MKKYRITIKADTNDGDYVTSTTDITEDKLPRYIDRFKKIIEVFESRGHNWVTGDIANSGELPEDMYEGKLTPEEIEWFDQLVPHGEYGIHTIESITIDEIGESIKIY